MYNLIMRYIGVDIGGTNTRIGVVEDLNIEKLSLFPTPHDLKLFLETLYREIEKVIDPYVDGVGIGIPGVVDPFSKRVLSCPNIPFLDNFPLTENLKKRFNIDIFIENDVNAGALAEMYIREERYKNILVLYIGTGIGGAVIIDRKLYQGTRGGAMEIGHMVVAYNGPLCVCGNRGCIETFVSGFGLKRMAKEYLGKEMEGRDIFNAYHAGDESVVPIVEEFLRYLKIGILNLSNIFAPDLVVIGGGIKGEISPFIDDIKAYLLKWGRNYRYNPFPIEISSIKEPGVVGASLLPLHLNSSH